MWMRTGRAVIVSIVLSGIGVSACGSSSSVASSTTVATASGAATAAPSGTGGATPGTGSDTPAGGTGTGGATRGAAYKLYTDCMAANGVTLPARTPRANGANTPGSGPVSTDPGAGATPGTGGNGGGGNGGGNGGGGFGGGFRPGGLTAPAGVDQAKYTAAAALCKDKLPTGGFGGGGGGGAGGRLNNPAYVACMKDNGIVLPTPTSTTVAGATTDSTPSTTPASTSSVVPPSTIDRTSAAYVAANAKCKVLLPNRGAGTAGGTGSTTTVAG